MQEIIGCSAKNFLQCFKMESKTREMCKKTIHSTGSKKERLSHWSAPGLSETVWSSQWVHHLKTPSQTLFWDNFLSIKLHISKKKNKKLSFEPVNVLRWHTVTRFSLSFLRNYLTPSLLFDRDKLNSSAWTAWDLQCPCLNSVFPQNRSRLIYGNQTAWFRHLASAGGPDFWHIVCYSFPLLCSRVACCKTLIWQQQICKCLTLVFLPVWLLIVRH